MKHKQVYLWFIISLFIKPLFGEEFCSTEVGNRDFRMPSIGNVKSLVSGIYFVNIKSQVMMTNHKEHYLNRRKNNE